MAAIRPQTGVATSWSFCLRSVPRSHWMKTYCWSPRCAIGHCRTTETLWHPHRTVFSDRNQAYIILIRQKTPSDGEVKVCPLPQQLIGSDTVVPQCLVVGRGLQSRTGRHAQPSTKYACSSLSLPLGTGASPAVPSTVLGHTHTAEHEIRLQFSLSLPLGTGASPAVPSTVLGHTHSQAQNTLAIWGSPRGHWGPPVER